jgi:iron(III) transport system permease protein
MANLVAASDGPIRTGRRIRLPVFALALMLLTGLPLFWLGFAALQSVFTGSNGLSATMLPTALRETATLMACVGLVTAGVGLLAAWLVAHFEFPGRRLFDWALILPLAVPTYLAAYTYTEFLGFTGPIQQAVRALTGGQTIRDYWFPDIRSHWGAVLVLSAVLYPYVYMACRAFFLMQSGSITLAARVLGAGPLRTFFTVTLPVARPAIIVGASLAMMEVVNDLGAVQYFGINSLTAIIYSTWINRSDFGGAAQLAVTIVLVIALLILLEQRARGARAYAVGRDSRVAPARIPLSGRSGVFACLTCLVILGLGFGIPFGQLTYMAFRRVTPEMLALTLNALGPTVTLGALGAITTVLIGFVAARQAQTRGPTTAGAVRFATLGYAVPGTVLALGLLQPFGQADLWFNRATMALFDWRPGLIISGSMAALVYVYAVRFLAVSHSTLDAAMKKRGDSVLHAGRLLGQRGLGLLVRVDLPTLSPAILTAATLVFVEIVKELPATLLLRPLGVDTLATVVYAHANVSLFASAALPAFAIVLVGLVPVILATRWSDRRFS